MIYVVVKLQMYCSIMYHNCKLYTLSTYSADFVFNSNIFKVTIVIVNILEFFLMYIGHFQGIVQLLTALESCLI